MNATVDDWPRVVDARAEAAASDASPPVVQLWSRAGAVAAGELPVMGLVAGDRPAADVDVLAGAVAVVEYELARRMYAATQAGAVPLTGPGGLLTARGWAAPAARRLARAGALAAEHGPVAAAWAAGVITAEHVDAIARQAQKFSADELAAVIGQLAGVWGQWSPAAIARFVTAAARLLHPPTQDPTRDETDAYTCRDLSFALLGDTVLLAGTLPRLEGEAVIAAIEGLAERLRTTTDHMPSGARRADALVELVNTAATAGNLPTRGGLPVALTVTLEHTQVGDPIWATSRGHNLTVAESRFTTCDPTLTPLLVAGPNPTPANPTPANPTPANPTPDGDPDRCPDPTRGLDPGCGAVAGTRDADPFQSPVDPRPPTPAERVAALAEVMLRGPRLPLAVGRTARTATAARRRALAGRDQGCVMPGCAVPAENCQAHHLTDWATGGPTDLDNLVLLCWAHHRQVDLNMWTIHPKPTPPLSNPPDPTPGAPPHPDPGAPPGCSWTANNNAPWTIHPHHRTHWRP